MATHLVWFRADLRIHDNQALAAACRDPHARVLACLSPRRASGISTVWRRGRRLLSSAICVACSQPSPSEELRCRWRRRRIFSASVQLLTDYCAQQQVSHLFYNYQYEINERQRDAAVEKRLSGVVCHGFDDALLLSPGSVLTGNHEMYKVFTPFKNAFLRRLREAQPGAWPHHGARPRPVTPAPPLPEIGYPQEAFDPHLLPRMRKRLSPDCAVSASNAADYDLQRDFLPRKAPVGCRHVWPWGYFPAPVPASTAAG